MECRISWNRAVLRRYGRLHQLMLILIVMCFGMITPVISATNLVPMPHSYQANDGAVTYAHTAQIYYDQRDAEAGMEASLEPLAHVLASEFELLTGIKPQVLQATNEHVPGPADIYLAFNRDAKVVLDETKQDQSYELLINAREIRISSDSYKGVVYGSATLLQSLRIEANRFWFPYMKVRDAPHAEYRGVMIDVARRPHSIETLREVIRMARLYKIRYLHLHLTDDQHFTFPFEPITGQLDNNASYTREELIDLVAYADARGVTIIPEMDLPGHSSRLRQSGYLDPSKNDFDVADPANYEKITAIIDDMLSVFESSPYFHIGGDESGAGRRLVPFLGAINRHLRGLPEGKQRRLMVWEGFHGAPLDMLPATGPDRVIVHSWESSYNPPWALLDNGYTLINSSWKPLYVVGNGLKWHPGGAVRNWDARLLYRWDKDTFMHWEPGRPVFRDADPDPEGDRNRSDRQWSAAENKQENQVLGGQLIFWEQREDTVINDLRERLPAVAERLWNPDKDLKFNGFLERFSAVDETVMTIVRPVEILPYAQDPDSPISIAYRNYTGEQVEVTIRNRSRIVGLIRYDTARFSDSLNYFGFDLAMPVTMDSTMYAGPMLMEGGFAIRAQLFRVDGSSIEGSDWQNFNNWPNRVKVTEFDVGDRVLDEVPDFTQFNAEKIKRKYDMPMLRGPMNHNQLIGQQFNATLIAPGTGEFTFLAKTRQGHASVYVDLNQDGKWDADEKRVLKTPRNEKPVQFKLDLVEGERYAVRVDHVTYLPGLVVGVQFAGPGVKGERADISGYLLPLTETKAQ